MDLTGKRVVVTRTREQAGEMLELLRERGAVPILFPTIEIVEPLDWGPVDEALDRMGEYQWVIFTSANGVKYFAMRAKSRGLALKDLLGDKDVCAIGPATARALQDSGINPALVPPRFVAEEVLDALVARGVSGKRILLPRAQVARDVLPRGLAGAGAQVDVVAVYRTVLPHVDEETRGEVEKAHIITFTSPSTVKNFLKIMEGWAREGGLEGKILASIGPVTSQAMRELGLRVDVEAREYTVKGLVEALEDL